MQGMLELQGTMDDEVSAGGWSKAFVTLCGGVSMVKLEDERVLAT